MTGIDISYTTLPSIGYRRYNSYTGTRNCNPDEMTSFLGDEGNKVIPLFARGPVSAKHENNYMSGNISSILSIISDACKRGVVANPDNESNAYFINDHLKKLLLIILQPHVRGTQYGVYSDIPEDTLIDSMNVAVQSCREEYNKYVNGKIDYSMRDNFTFGWSHYRSYKEVMYHFLMGSNWGGFCTRTYINGHNLRYVVGDNFLGTVLHGEIIPLLATVTKPEYMEYIRRSNYLNKKIDPRTLQVWINPQFDVPRSVYKGIRPIMRKLFLIPMYDAGVKIVETTDFNSLFKQYTPPKVNSIGEYKKWLNNCSIESINNLKSNLKNE